MRLKYQFTLLLLAVTASVWPGLAQAQEVRGDTLVVEWSDANGAAIRNALRDAIALDTERPAGRVYLLRRGGFYWLEDAIQYSGFDLRIVGETESQGGPDSKVCGPNMDQDCGPAIIQRVRRTDQTVTGIMIQNSGDGSDLYMKNVWIMGQDNEGAASVYEPLALNTKNARFEFDGVIFDHNAWHHLGVNGENNDLIIRNSYFRNLLGLTQQWEGLGLRLEVGADTVIIENNTFLNIGFTPFQSEAAPANYVLFNHNTLVNIGRSFQAGAIWKDAFVTNNLIVNGFWHGTGRSDWRNELPGDDPHVGFFGIAALPSAYGTELQRRIVLANNSYWRDPAFATYYADSIRAQPFVNDTTMGWFAKYEGMVIEGNYIDVNPNLNVYPDVVPQMIQSIRDLRAGTVPATSWVWDPGRPAEAFLNNWPLPEDFTYTNPQLLTGGTDGLPLGNLNYFPAAKATYETNREQYVADIVAKAGKPPVFDLVGTYQGENATLAGDAAVKAHEGFTYYFMGGSGTITWTFDVAQAGTYGIRLHTNMGTETQRGQHVRVNGVGLKNNSGYGEFYFCTAAQSGCASPIPGGEWTTVDITASGLVEGGDALNLNQGTNTIQLAPSWGWQSFSGVDILDANGNVVLALTAPDAQVTLVEPRCEGAEYCPQGFSQAGLNAGGSASFVFDAPATGNYVLRVFYQAPNGNTTADVLVNNQTVLPGVAFNAADAKGYDVMTGQFAMNKGVNTITVASPAGGLNIDYVQIIGVNLQTAVDENELPEGYALDQNYPNPFNPTTTINFTLAQAGSVRLTVYDVMGRQVKTLVSGTMPAGTFKATWDGLTASGTLAASGVYFYRLETPVGQKVRSMVLLK